MEYEIDDDPQGVTDGADGDRRGGIAYRNPAFRTIEPGRPRNRHDDAADEDSAVPKQMA